MNNHDITRRSFNAAALAGGFAGLLGRPAVAEQEGPSGRPDPRATLIGRRPFRDDDPWNRDVSRMAVDRLSDRILRRAGLEKPLHPDFGTMYQGAPNGIPYVVVPGTQPKVPVTFRYPDESDPGPYPIPPDAPIEGGPKGEGDRHVLVVDRDNWKLYELFSARPKAGGKSWEAGSGAIFDLTTNAPRPAGWTSADAAGLPILPGLVRYEDVVTQGGARHAFRFTVVKTRRAYIAPARHFASRAADVDLPPMGLRVRLKASFDTGKFPPQARAILTTLKTHGMLLADNGGDWYLSGAPDPRWNDDDLHTLKQVKVRDFEVLKMVDVMTR